MTPSLLLASLFLAAAPLARGAAPTQAQTEIEALRLKRRLDVINRVLDEKMTRTVTATVGIASIAATYSKWVHGEEVLLFATRAAPQKPGSPQEAAAESVAMAPWIELRKETSALELESALLADQLQRYKETGVLSPTPPATVASIKRLLDHPWGVLPPSEPEAPFLRGGLIELQKQLRQYDKIGRRPPVERRLAPARPVAQSLPALKIPSAPPAAAAPRRPRFEADAGMGRPESDPLPELIVLLSSSEPRGRALAADELGNLGAQAAPAVSELRRKLADPDRRVRASAAQALGTIGAADASVLDDLQRALRDPNEEVRLSARAALQRLLPAFAPRAYLPLPAH